MTRLCRCQCLFQYRDHPGGVCFHLARERKLQAQHFTQAILIHPGCNRWHVCFGHFRFALIACISRVIKKLCEVFGTYGVFIGFRIISV